MSIVALIPARGGSKGVPNKNIKTLGEKPLIAHTIDVALNCNYINRVIVSTDDEEIASISRFFGAEVPFMRPKNLATDNATTIDVIKHAITYLEENSLDDINHIVLLQPTSPLRTLEDLNKALELYLSKSRKTGLISLCEARTHPYLLKRVEGEVVNDYIKKPAITRRQEYPKVFELNGAIYIFPKGNIKANYIYNEEAIPFIMSKENSIDIDDELDFLIAEAILNKRSVFHVSDRK